ncbi:MAG TPA: class I SAM-dependent methyltransferase [Chloroflexia bacterium]|nr:class I SAM-dependent methyltransferase [Chloroflexia bacterium]
MTYAALVRYYDLENADFTEDLDYWLELADEAGDPLLELGCGTGRVLLNLARRGHAITGLDNSPEMLARLHTKLEAASSRHLAAAPQIVQAGLEDFELAQRYRLALMPFNTFMHLLTTDAQLAVLARIRRHLVPGGLLALDMPNPGDAYAAEHQGVTLERTFADGDRIVQQFSSIAIDRAAQLAQITWNYDATDPAGAVERSIVPLTLRYTFPAEMRLLLERSGLSLTHLYGDYDRSPFVDGSPRMLAVAAAV